MKTRKEMHINRIDTVHGPEKRFLTNQKDRQPFHPPPPDNHTCNIKLIKLIHINYIVIILLHTFRNLGNQPKQYH